MGKIAWDINAWNGEQDNDYIWPAWCFVSGIWVDIRKNPPFLKASARMEEEFTYDDDICLQKNLEEIWLSWNLVCLDNGKVYIDDTLKFTISTGTSAWNRVLWLGYISDVSWTPYIYLISDTSSWTGKIHKCPTNLSTHTASYITYETSWSVILDKIPVINETTRFVFWVNNKVFEMDNQEVITQYLEFPDNEEVSAITEFQNFYKVYSNIVSSSPVSWIRRGWDWTSYEVDYKIHWKNTPILDAVNNEAFDYVVAWYNKNYSDLYIVAGSQSQPKRVNPEWKLNWRKFWPYISIRLGIIYISWERNGIKWIYTFWSYQPWFPESLVLEFVPTMTNTNDFLHHTHTETKSYFSCADNKIYSVSYNTPPDNYVNNCIVETKYWTWNKLFTQKSLDYMYVGYYLPNANYSINVYARKGTWSYKLLTTITDHTKEWVMISAIEFKSIDLWDFYKLQLKFELIWPEDQTDSAWVWPVTLFCNDNYNR